MHSKKILSLGLIVLLLGSIHFSPSQANGTGLVFLDTQGHWANQYIHILSEKCNLNGYVDLQGNLLYQFRPDNPITRAELVKMLVQCKYGNSDASSGQEFIDVAANAWYAPFVYKAKTQGWITGYSDGRFHPDWLINRAEALKIILLSHFSDREIQGNKDQHFWDLNSGVWYARFVQFAAIRGFITGSNGYFYPSRSITRAEAAKIIVKVFGWDTDVNENTNAPVSTNSNSSVSVGGVATIGGCSVFPADNSWNQDVSTLPVHANSENFIASIGASTNLHADFGGNGEYGIPYVVVPADQTKLPINFTAYGDESDAGPYPVPANAPIEGGSDSDGDRHVLVVQSGACKLYELYRAFYNGRGWDADAGVIFDLTSNALRPEGWTSADAAGLPILPGLARYDEVAAGVINHALRFTVSKTQKGYIHPATHYASSSTNANLPPMGLRLRLKSSFDVSHFTGQTKIILTALKKYGMIVADNGSNWYITGASDTRWDDEDLNQLKTVPGSSFEVVDTGPIVN